MFFIGIFGIFPEDKKIKDVTVENYPGYPMGIKGDLYRNSSVFEFFFVPVFRFNRKYYIKFPDSKNIYLLEKDVAEDLLKRDSEINFLICRKVISKIMVARIVARSLRVTIAIAPIVGKNLNK